MGRIRHLLSGQEHVLLPHHLVGRAPGSHLRLSNPRVSGCHARLHWHGSSWEMHDLASKNGSYVNDKRLDRGGCIPVLAGSVLAFGDRKNLYEVVDDGPPHANAVSANGTRVYAQDGMLWLPDAGNPELLIFRQDDEWFLDVQPRRRLEDQHELLVGGGPWVLNLPRISEPTVEAERSNWRLDNITLRFFVSRDCEHVDLELDNGIRRLRLPQHVYWYTLLVLAHCRQRELAQGVPEPEAGWMSVKQLHRELRGCQQPADVLNHHVYRIKKTFRKVEVRDFNRIIERRLALRQIRTAVQSIDIQGAWQ